MDFFELGTNGEKYGPADITTLNVWISEGRLLPSSQLQSTQTGAISVASQVPGLMFPENSFQQPPTQTAPPTVNQATSFGTPFQPPFNQQPGQPMQPYPRGSNGRFTDSFVTNSWLCFAGSVICCPPVSFNILAQICLILSLNIIGIIYANKANAEGNPNGKKPLYFNIGGIVIRFALAWIGIIAGLTDEFRPS
jgi:hypothetical protein